MEPARARAAEASRQEESRSLAERRRQEKTLADVGRGYRDASTVTELLRSQDRTRAGRTAPASGLTLVEVFYPETVDSLSTV